MLGEGGVRVDEVLLLVVEAEVKEAMEARACVGRGLRGVGERGVPDEEDVGRGGWAERDCWA